MFVIRVDLDSSRTRRWLSDLEKRQIPFAAAAALTQVAENARMDTVREIKSKLKAPTEYAINSMFKKPATKDRLEAMVYVKTYGRVGETRGRVRVGKAQNEVLGHLFSGGDRAFKRFEAALFRIGLLPSGWAAVPGDGLQLDAFGNIPRGFIMQMLSYFKALRESKDWMSDSGRAKFGKKMGKQFGVGGAAVEYFVSRGRGNWFGKRSWREGRIQNLPPGIWMRARVAEGRTSIKPMIMFVKKPSYQRMFDLEQIARTALKRDWDAAFKRTFDDAMNGRIGETKNRANVVEAVMARGRG
jgi:hypothetical protein